jgi:hypothetical protein
MGATSNRAGIFHKIAVCLYAITLPALAQSEQPVTNIAGPQAVSTGSVTNQAVQVLNGPYMTNTYGGGVSCQGPSFNLSPFVYSSHSFNGNPESYNNTNLNPGLAGTFTFPLDNSLQVLCKSRAKAETDRQIAETAKARLDFELVRLLKCGEAKQKGIDFHPQSPYYAVCADITVNQKQTVRPVSAPISSRAQNN